MQELDGYLVHFDSLDINWIPDIIHSFFNLPHQPYSGLDCNLKQPS